MSFRLPADYQSRETLSDAPGAFVEQDAVNEFVEYVVRRGQFERVIDIGGGSVKKLNKLKGVELYCVGDSKVRQLVGDHIPETRFIGFDLEQGLPKFDASGTLIVCSNTFERRRNPEPLAKALAQASRDSAFTVISTPDRSRRSGLLDSGPPLDPNHTMEWTADEFGRFLIDSGFPSNILLGHSFGDRTTLIRDQVTVISGKDADFTAPGELKTVSAIINVFNEIDILETVVRYLDKQGVDVHIVDNWSHDGSFELANELKEKGLCANVLRFPERPTNEYQWANQLLHTAEYAAKLSTDWVIHYDADEIRMSPWLGTTLQEAISFVDARGYSEIDFTILNFFFTETESPRFSPESLRFFDFGRQPGHFRQVKAWRNIGQVVDLASTGGHQARFAGAKIFPLKFLTRHYPLRSTEQANLKLFRDRLPRIETERREKNWHTQYDTYRSLSSIPPWRKHELLPFDAPLFFAEHLVERLSGVGIEVERNAIPNIAMRLDEITRGTTPR